MARRISPVPPPEAPDHVKAIWLETIRERVNQLSEVGEISSVSGGATVDTECRTAVNAIIALFNN